jgi:hypothetical protein
MDAFFAALIALLWYTETKRGMLNAALAQHVEATLVTGDPEFRPLEGVLDIQWLAQREGDG